MSGIKTTTRGGANAGRGDQPYPQWHPSMGEPKTAAGGSGKKPPKSPKVTTGGSKDKGKNDKPSKSGGNYPHHVLPLGEVSRDMHSQSDAIMKQGNVYHIPDSFWGHR